MDKKKLKYGRYVNINKRKRDGKVSQRRQDFQEIYILTLKKRENIWFGLDLVVVLRRYECVYGKISLTVLSLSE